MHARSWFICRRFFVVGADGGGSGALKVAVYYVCGEVFYGGVGEDGGGVDEYGYVCEVGGGGSGLVDGEEREVGDVDGAFGGAREVGWIGVE